MSKITFSGMMAVFQASETAGRRILMPTPELGAALMRAVNDRPQGRRVVGSHEGTEYSIYLHKSTVMLHVQFGSPLTLREVRNYLLQYESSSTTAFMPDGCSDPDIQAAIDTNLRNRRRWDENLKLEGRS